MCETEVALSANQGRVLKNLIDTLDIGDIDLSGYSKTSHTHSNYSLTSHTHSAYASSSHTHPISAVTNLQSTLDGKSSTSHTHSAYYDSSVSRTKNTVLAAPNGSAGTATFRALVAADIPSLAISKITNLQSSLDGKSSTSHTHNYTSTVKVGSTSYNVSANTISLPSYPTLTTLSGVSTTTFNTHSGNTTVHITSAERTKWNGVVTNWNNVFEIDSNGDLKVKVNLIGTKEISAYGSGTTTSSSGSGSVTVYDGLDSTETEVALSANQGRVLKNLIDTLDIGDIDLSGYSKTSHTHSNYSLTSHTHSGYASTSHTHTQYASSSHTHPISAVTNLQTTLNGKSSTSHTHSTYSLTSHTHSTYYDSAVSRTKNTVLAAPNGSAGTATFRALVAADIPSLAISKITNLQSTLDGKSSTSHTHSNYSLTSHTHSAYATTGHTHSSLTFSGGTFSAKTYNPSGATTVNIPTSTSHLTNNSGYITSAATVANSNKFSGYTMRSAATWVNNSVEAYIQYTIDATSLSTSNFYPIIFPTTQKDLYVRMYSTPGSSSAAYNQNKLEFTFRRTRMERYSTRFNSTFL